MKMEATYCCEAKVDFLRTARRYIPQYGTLRRVLFFTTVATIETDTIPETFDLYSKLMCLIARQGFIAIHIIQKLQIFIIVALGFGKQCYIVIFL
jgi:hypothetical protein